MSTSTVAGLPQYVVLRAKSNGNYLQYQWNDEFGDFYKYMGIRRLVDEVSPFVKIEVVPSTTDTSFVHLKSSYSEKYFQSWSIHSKWQAFRGDSTDAKDLIFTTTMDSTDMRKAKMGVFLGKNKSEKVWDFKLKGGFFGSSIIYSAPDPSSTAVNIVVQVHHPKQHNISDRDQSIYSGKDNYTMRIYPNIDYTFSVSLLVILDDIYNLSARLTQNHKQLVCFA